MRKDIRKMVKRRCKECGDEIVSRSILSLQSKNMPYYCQTCSEDKEEYETEIVEDNYV